jgi:hypothetical protein
MVAYQLELFQKSELELLREEVRELKKSISNVRKGLFARHEDLVDDLQEARLRNDKLEDALNQMTERMKHYEAALFPVESVEGFFTSGLRSTSCPVSSLIISSQASSTGLSLPQK